MSQKSNARRGVRLAIVQAENKFGRLEIEGKATMADKEAYLDRVRELKDQLAALEAATEGRIDDQKAEAQQAPAARGRPPTDGEIVGAVLVADAAGTASDGLLTAGVEAQERLEKRQEAAKEAEAPPTPQEIVAAREAVAALLEKKGERRVAKALRGDPDIGFWEGGQELRKFLARFPSDRPCPFEPVVKAAIDAADKAVAAARKRQDEEAALAEEKCEKHNLWLRAQNALAKFGRRICK